MTNHEKLIVDLSEIRIKQLELENKALSNMLELYQLNHKCVFECETCNEPDAAWRNRVEDNI